MDLGKRCVEKKTAHWISWCDTLPVIQARAPVAADWLLHALQGHVPLPAAAAANQARNALRATGYDAPAWASLLDASDAPPARGCAFEPGDALRGWQRQAAGACDERACETHLSDLTLASRALLLSQAGPQHALCPSHHRRTHARGRVHSECAVPHSAPAPPAPAPVTRRGRLDAFGDHRAACATSGVLATRAGPLERAVARFCREAGARVARNADMNNMNIDFPSQTTGASKLWPTACPFGTARSSRLMLGTSPRSHVRASPTRGLMLSRGALSPHQRGASDTARSPSSSVPGGAAWSSLAWKCVGALAPKRPPSCASWPATEPPPSQRTSDQRLRPPGWRDGRRSWPLRPSARSHLPCSRPPPSGPRPPRRHAAEKGAWKKKPLGGGLGSHANSSRPNCNSACRTRIAWCSNAGVLRRSLGGVSAALTSKSGRTRSASGPGGVCRVPPVCRPMFGSGAPSSPLASNDCSVVPVPTPRNQGMCSEEPRSQRQPSPKR